MTQHDGLWIAVATIAGAVASKAFDAFSRRRERSGSVSTSSASDLWKAMDSDRLRQERELARMDGRMDQLQADNNALRETNARLLVANEGLVNELDGLRERHRVLITKNQELASLNEKLERRLEELLAFVGERATDGLIIPPMEGSTP